MGLTWKDVVTTVFMGAIAAGYAAFWEAPAPG